MKNRLNKFKLNKKLVLEQMSFYDYCFVIVTSRCSLSRKGETHLLPHLQMRWWFSLVLFKRKQIWHWLLSWNNNSHVRIIYTLSYNLCSLLLLRHILYNQTVIVSSVPYLFLRTLTPILSHWIRSKVAVVNLNAIQM